MRIVVLVLVAVLAGCGSTESESESETETQVDSNGWEGDLAGMSGPGLCGDPRLQGTKTVTIKRPISRCSIQTPVKITSIAGIKLTTPAVLDCSTAKTFADWLTRDADPAARRHLGGKIEKVWVMAGYACRSRNNKRGARLSEHAFGRAIDIGGMWLSTGKRVSVQSDWGGGPAGKYLREIWKAACGPFKTVLGPEADRYHRDHFHFDRARRGSTYCR